MFENNKKRQDGGTDDFISKKLKKVDDEEECENARKKELVERIHEISSNPRKFILESRTAVDPFSYSEKTAHAYREGDMIFSVILGLSEDEHAFNKIQILENNNNDSRVCFYTIKGDGSNMSGLSSASIYLEIECAKEEFNRTFKELPGNIFGRKPYVRHPGKYYEIEVDPKCCIY